MQYGGGAGGSREQCCDLLWCSSLFFNPSIYRNDNIAIVAQYADKPVYVTRFSY